MKNGAAIRGDNKSSKATVAVSQETRTPMVGWREGNLEWTKFDELPFIKLMDNVEPEPMH